MSALELGRRPIAPGPLTNHFGRMLRSSRRHLGCTLAQVAESIGCSISYVSDVEQGRRLPLDGAQIRQVATLLEVPAERLALAAALDRRSVTIRSDREDVLELAVMFAEVMARGDPEEIGRVGQLLEQIEDA